MVGNLFAAQNNGVDAPLGGVTDNIATGYADTASVFGRDLF